MAKNKKTTVNERIIKVFVITALVVFPLGYVTGNSLADSDIETTTEDAHSHADDMEDDHSSDMHSHSEMQEVESAENAPEISNLRVTKDNKSGWNVSFDTENFRFAPENASTAHNEGEGHAHIYVDGEKITRLYANDYYLGELSEGEHTVMVTLNTNDHKDYSLNGDSIGASIAVVDSHHTEE